MTTTDVQVTPAEEPSTHTPVDGGVNVTESEDQGKRVFIANLAYTTTNEELDEFIKKSSEKIARIERPQKRANKGAEESTGLAGYAFVTYETEEAAQAAVEKLDKLTLGDREIGAQIAKSQAVKQQERKAKDAAKKQANKERKAAAAAEAAANAPASTATDAEAAPSGEVKKSKKKRAKRPARRLPEEGEDAPAEPDAITTNEAGETTATPAPRAKKPRNKKKAKSAAAGSDEAAKTDADKEEEAEEARIDNALIHDGKEDGAESTQQPKEKKQKAPRQLKWTQTDKPSTTTLFVANLPFDIDDAALSEIFTKLDIQITSASIINKPSYNKKAPPRSKGFGFVEVADENVQKLALEKLQGHMIGDREIAIRVANQREPVVEETPETPAVEEQTAAE